MVTTERKLPWLFVLYVLRVPAKYPESASKHKPHFVGLFYPPVPYNQVGLVDYRDEGAKVLKRRRKLIGYLLLIFLIGWPLYQISQMVGSHVEKQDAGKLLYQVSSFQMELLGSYLHDVNQLQGTGGLDLLRQAVYTANFTHEHLVLAFGEDKLTRLNGLTQLMQYVVRIQIGGQRPLKPDEARTLEQVRQLYEEMYDAYGRLLSPSYGIVSEQNKRLVKTDKDMTELLKKRLVE
jgi:hypothetical protein